MSEQQLDIGGPFYDIVVALLHTDALYAANASLDHALAGARARASAPATAYLTSRRGWISLRRGAIAAAEADARTALELLTNHGIPLGIPFAVALLVLALIETGDHAGAEQALSDSGLGAELQPGLTNNWLLEARGVLRLEQGRTQEGYDDIVEFGRRHEQWGGANPLASRWRSRAALALADLGDVPSARVMAAQDLERARRWGAPTGIGVALRAGALVEGPQAPVAMLAQAAAVLVDSPSRLVHARALVDLGAALRRANRRADARVALRDGLERAERCRAGMLAAQARTELRAAGGPVSDPLGTGVEQLTVSERRVAELAAAGRSNPADRAGPVRDAQDRRDPPRQRLPQARHPGAGRAGLRADFELKALELQLRWVGKVAGSVRGEGAFLPKHAGGLPSLGTCAPIRCGSRHERFSMRGVGELRTPPRLMERAGKPARLPQCRGSSRRSARA